MKTSCKANDLCLSRWWFPIYFHPDLGKIPILTNIFQMGSNHQVVLDLSIFGLFHFQTLPLSFLDAGTEIGDQQKLMGGVPHIKIAAIFGVQTQNTSDTTSRKLRKQHKNIVHASIVWGGYIYIHHECLLFQIRIIFPPYLRFSTRTHT